MHLLFMFTLYCKMTVFSLGYYCTASGHYSEPQEILYKVRVGAHQDVKYSFLFVLFLYAVFEQRNSLSLQFMVSVASGCLVGTTKYIYIYIYVLTPQY